MEEKHVDDFDDGCVDEFFGDAAEDSGEDEQASTMAQRELAALEKRLTTLGYQDGVDDGVEEVVQKGFDKGYAEGAAAGWETGMLYGGTAAAVAAISQATTVVERDRRGPGATSRAGKGGAEHVSATVVVGEQGGTVASTLGICSSPEGSLGGGDGAVKQTAAASGELAILVEELRRASLCGPDEPPIDKADVVRRLILAGSPISAVADGMGE